jgi:ketosteroid isomerase-like protein
MTRTPSSRPAAARRAAARLAALVLAAGAAAAPVAAQVAPPAGAAAELPGVALPPELDRVLRDYEQGWRAGDAAALAALFAEDGFVLQGGRAPARGRAAIRAAYTGQAGGPLRLRALAYAAADTVGYIIGGFRYGDAAADGGKFTLTLRRASGGRWLIFSDMDNPNRAPGRPGAGGPPRRHRRAGGSRPPPGRPRPASSPRRPASRPAAAPRARRGRVRTCEGAAGGGR